MTDDYHRARAKREEREMGQLVGTAFVVADAYGKGLSCLKVEDAR